MYIYNSFFTYTTDVNDFTPVSQVVVFNENTINGSECFSLSIVDDSILETSEMFLVTLNEELDTALTFLESVLTVTITDDDSKSSQN